MKHFTAILLISFSVAHLANAQSLSARGTTSAPEQQRLENKLLSIEPRLKALEDIVVVQSEQISRTAAELATLRSAFMEVEEVSRSTPWMAPPVCEGADKALQWNGTDWICASMTGGGILCQGQLLRVSGGAYGMSASATLPLSSRGTASSVPVAFYGSNNTRCETGDGFGGSRPCTMYISCTATATCNPNGTWSFSACNGVFDENGWRQTSISVPVVAKPN